MKLGKDTGSVNNWIMGNGVKGQPTPEVGMGATVLHWTDRSPATIVGVFKERGAVVIEVQGDRYKRIDGNGMSECQDYEYTRDPEGPRSLYRQGKRGHWEQVKRNPETGRLVKTGGAGLRIGDREKYHDFSF